MVVVQSYIENKKPYFYCNFNFFYCYNTKKHGPIQVKNKWTHVASYNIAIAQWNIHSLTNKDPWPTVAREPCIQLKYIG